MKKEMKYINTLSQTALIHQSPESFNFSFVFSFFFVLHGLVWFGFVRLDSYFHLSHLQYCFNSGKLVTYFEYTQSAKIYSRKFSNKKTKNQFYGFQPEANGAHPRRMHERAASKIQYEMNEGMNETGIDVEVAYYANVMESIYWTLDFSPSQRYCSNNNGN